jgi:hypothetical protein
MIAPLFYNIINALYSPACTHLSSLHAEKAKPYEAFHSSSESSIPLVHNNLFSPADNLGLQVPHAHTFDPVSFYYPSKTSDFLIPSIAMFRLLKSGLPEDPVYPADLKELG